MGFDLDSFIAELNGGNAGAGAGADADPFAGSEPVAAVAENTPAPAAPAVPGHDTAASPAVATETALLLLARDVAAIKRKLEQNGWHI